MQGNLKKLEELIEFDHVILRAVLEDAPDEQFIFTNKNLKLTHLLFMQEALETARLELLVAASFG